MAAPLAVANMLWPYRGVRPASAAVAPVPGASGQPQPPNTYIVSEPGAAAAEWPNRPPEVALSDSLVQVLEAKQYCHMSERNWWPLRPPRTTMQAPLSAVATTAAEWS
eukprot:scaffold240585_cov36-Prasinocladus_malaysianus.AAC.1